MVVSKQLNTETISNSWMHFEQSLMYTIENLCLECGAIDYLKSFLKGSWFVSKQPNTETISNSWIHFLRSLICSMENLCFKEKLKTFPIVSEMGGQSCGESEVQVKLPNL